ncbi:MAG: glycosyltransferase [Candidatus Cloacimonetes bacterium]|nr:glycosyltransferase [Candidatus Cloacimonadota bacterium]MDD2506520.1 glycosyltransferase [Candidatus Cloacimonadota bacterium]MDD4148041.1 glycosyltransferase [Candidatus Cloacimonadota bacterium]MDD4559842.1 glycosyltransferase [Candidatus Cloacimonadota bacterium]
MITQYLYWLLLALVASGAVTYIVFVIRFYFGWKNLSQKKSHKKLRVSVVVVGRNEAKNLPRLLTCLLSQDYPNELYEIVFGDDDSEDETEAILQQYINQGHNIRYIKSVGRDGVVSPKKMVLNKVILAAEGDIILTTDADCMVPFSWISSMVSCFTDDVSMVAGYSRTLIPVWSKAGILQKYEHLDFALTYMVLGGGYTLGKSWACIGQNLAYRKSAWEDVGGFKKIWHLMSGDDVNLMQLMRRKGHKIIFNFSPASFVHTHPVSSWKQFINQRSRWASNMKYQLKFNPEFFFILFSMACLYWGSIILFFINLKLGLLVLMYRILIEQIMISYSRKHFGISARMLSFYPIWLIIQTFMLVFTMLLGQFNIFVWHGKRPPRRRLNASNNI